MCIVHLSLLRGGWCSVKCIELVSGCCKDTKPMRVNLWIVQINLWIVKILGHDSHCSFSSITYLHFQHIFRFCYAVLAIIFYHLSFFTSLVALNISFKYVECLHLFSLLLVLSVFTGIVEHFSGV